MAEAEEIAEAAPPPKPPPAALALEAAEALEAPPRRPKTPRRPKPYCGTAQTAAINKTKIKNIFIFFKIFGVFRELLKFYRFVYTSNVKINICKRIYSTKKLQGISLINNKLNKTLLDGLM